jgi:hypothetical protein
MWCSTWTKRKKETNMQHAHTRVSGLLLLCVLALLLTACTIRVEPETAQQPTSTPLPAATQQPAALVGTEWTRAYEGDLNGDGVRDVVAYKPASIELAPEMQTQPYAGPDSVVASELVVVQESGRAPQMQASVSPQGVAAYDTTLLGAAQFGEPGPAAFLVNIQPQAADTQVSMIPLNAEGNAYGQGFGLYWNEGQLAYRLFVGGQAVPPPNTPAGSTQPLTPPADAQAPDTMEIALYWADGEMLQPEYRTIPIPPDQAVGRKALELLLQGPEQPNLNTAIPTPDEVQAYPGRQPDWGNQVRLLGLNIENGVATANFSQEMQAYGGGSARVQMIREQITQTLLQFPTVQEVRIAVEGEVETALQP